MNTKLGTETLDMMFEWWSPKLISGVKTRMTNTVIILLYIVKDNGELG